MNNIRAIDLFKITKYFKNRLRKSLKCYEKSDTCKANRYLLEKESMNNVMERKLSKRANLSKQ